MSYRTWDEAQVLATLPPAVRKVAEAAMDLRKTGVGDAAVAAFIARMPVAEAPRPVRPAVATPKPVAPPPKAAPPRRQAAPLPPRAEEQRRDTASSFAPGHSPREEQRRELARLFELAVDRDLEAAGATHTSTTGDPMPKKTDFDPVRDVSVLCTSCVTLNPETAAKCSKCGAMLKAGGGK